MKKGDGGDLQGSTKRIVIQTRNSALTKSLARGTSRELGSGGANRKKGGWGAGDFENGVCEKTRVLQQRKGA